MVSSQKNPGTEHLIVPRHWLYAVSGAIWCAVGLLLCTRGWIWIAQISPEQAIATESFAILLAFIFYYFGFSKITKRNIDRISSLPERSSVFLFTARRGYILIAIMMTAGFFLRNSPISKLYLSIPYTSMGGALLLGGFRFLTVFYRTFTLASSDNQIK